MLRLLGLASMLISLATVSAGQPEKKVFPPDHATRKQIREQTLALGNDLLPLHGTAVQAYLPDVEVYHKAAQWALQLEEWPQKESAAWTLEALEQGRKRLEKLKAGQPEWWRQGGRVVLGYRSKLDNSVQPYAVTYPRDFKPDRLYRLDVVLHGRDGTLNEVKFLHQHRAGTAPEGQDFIQLEVFGRGNNAYRWAGESDVLEAMNNFIYFSAQFHGRPIVDPARVVLRGFSMGGAGAWHLGLHYPHYWRAVSPGAGFTTTKGYVKNLPDPLPPHQEACLRIYDATAVAENVFCTPFIAYGGEKDPQLQAARNIEALVKPLGTPFPGAFPLQVIVGPDTAHKYHPQSLQEIMRQLKQHTQAERPDYPPVIRFVPTTHHGNCHWVNVIALSQAYAPALIAAKFQAPNRFHVMTKNVEVFRLYLPPSTTPVREVQVEVDGQSVKMPPFPTWWPVTFRQRETVSVMLERQEGRWTPTFLNKYFTDVQQPRKNLALAGPIDDAFRQPFVCVIGTGQPWNAAVHKHAEAELARFLHEWRKYFRGELLVKRDVEVSSSDLESRHLILFGDPGSNPFIAQALDRLPVTWTRDEIRFGGQTYSAKEHLPKLIYPSRFQAGKYVVLNSGHTFHAADFEGTNALLYPRLGDYAIVKVKTPGQEEVLRAGLFVERWKVK